MNLEVNSKDVIRLILQFMKESNLTESLKSIQTESDVVLNTVDNMEQFVEDIQLGRWDSVLTEVNNLKLSKEKLICLYEQIILELLENGEKELAKEFLLSSEPMLYCRTEQSERYLKLEQLCKRTYFNLNDAYEAGSSKKRNRQEIADSLINEVSVVAPSRLLNMLGQSLKFQQVQGSIPVTNNYDLFQGGIVTVNKDIDEKYPKKTSGNIRFSKDSHPETILFSPDGQSLVTGSIDGFIELWDFDSCKLRKDLEYQSKDELMMHDEAVLCVAYSSDSEYLASCSQGGKIKVWKVSTGQCLRKFNQAHNKGITSVCFSKEGTQLLTSSFDHTARVHGMKSGKTLKEFRGHTSFVNQAIYTKDGSQILTASSDSTVKLWDFKTSDNLLTFRPGYTPGCIVKEITIHTIQLNPKNPDQIFVCTKSNQAYLLNTQGQVIKSYSSGKQEGGDFICATISPQGKWLYCMGEDGILYIFDVFNGKLESVLQITDREVIGITHHPYRNIITTITDDGLLKLWKP